MRNLYLYVYLSRVCSQCKTVLLSALALPDIHHEEVARSDFVYHVALKRAV